MFCVLVGSVMNGWFKLANRTGSIAEMRASDRGSRAGTFCFNDVESDDTVPPTFQGWEFLTADDGALWPASGPHP